VRLSPEAEIAHMTGRLLTLDRVTVPAFPHPSLALTSTLGNIYLPFLQVSSSNDIQPIPNADSRSRLCVTFAALVNQSLTHTTELDGDDFKITFLSTLFLHCAFAKDYLAYPAAMSTWSIFPGFSETELLDFQSNCIAVLDHVHSPSRPS
jgi:hypothetical protein